MNVLWATAIVAMCLASPGAAAPSGALRGETGAESSRERLTESQFIDVPTAQGALETGTVVGARPHYSGTTADYALAVYMRDRMRAAGISAELEPFSARVDTPRELVLELAPPAELSAPSEQRHFGRRRTAFPVALDLSEPPQASDPATAARSIGLPFAAGSADGDVSAPLVYASRGGADDYQTLVRAGVDVNGAILLLRSGLQPLWEIAERAQARGAAGVLFYADPKDDGAGRGPVYPDGPWRPAGAIERGWVGSNLRIPALPISATNAALLLSSLRGATGPADWAGTLAVAYPVGRGPGRVHLIVKLNHKQTALWNTIGTIPGINGADTIILGAHRDAWVYGVGDNGAGIAALLEVARGFGFLLQSGWRPQRSIVIAGWDGEGAGLAGSREYLRTNAVAIARGCFAYLDADRTNTGAQFVAGGVAALTPLMNDVSRTVEDPRAPGTTVYSGWVAQAPGRIPRADEPAGGSDDEVFLAGADVPVGTLGFHGPFGVDGTSADTLHYATLFSDSDFSLHRTVAQLYGVLALRLADTRNVPYTFAGYGALLRSGLADLNQRARQAGVPVDVMPLRRAIDRFELRAGRFDRMLGRDDRDVAHNELSAVHVLDMLCYDIRGDSNTAYPAVVAALGMHDSGRTATAIAAAVELVNQATQALPR